MLHGGPGAPGGMAPLARLLSDYVRVIEPLQRRSGQLPLTVAQHVADLHEVLTDVAQPVHLVGSSWGAMLALTYAARHRDGLRQVVLIGCGTFDELGRAEYQSRMKARTSPEDRIRLSYLDAQLAAQSDASRRDALFAQMGDVALANQSHALLTTEFEQLRADEQGHYETWEDAVRLQRTGIQPAEFANIDCPVLMLHGADDPHPGPMIRDSLAPVVRILRYHEFVKCGHMPWLERHARDEFLCVLQEALVES